MSVGRSVHVTNLQCVAVCGSVLQCVAVCCSVLTCHQLAVCCSVLQCVAVWLRRVAVCCSVLQSVAACRVPSRTQSRTHSAHCTPVTVRVMAAFLCTPARWYPIMTWVCCSVLQCVAVCCSVLQCVAGCCSVTSDENLFHTPPSTHTHTHTHILSLYLCSF